jgi:hypothetical protein
MGMGVGLGSVRASSLPIALLANVGVIGTLLFGALLVSVARAIPSSNRSSSDEELGRSGAVAALVLVIPATIGAGGIDLGLYFKHLRRPCSLTPHRVGSPADYESIGPRPATLRRVR